MMMMIQQLLKTGMKLNYHKILVDCPKLLSRRGKMNTSGSCQV